MAKIIHVLSSFKVGGAERFVIDLGVVQSSNNDKVTIFSTSEKKEILVSELDGSEIDTFLSEGSRWKDYLLLMSVFKGSQRKILHLHSPWVLRYFLPLLPLFYIKNVRIIYTRHGLNPLPGKAWGFIHFFAKPFVSKVTFVSAAGKDVFYKRFKWLLDKLIVISNGVYVPKDFMKSPSGKIRLGSVGRMVKLKGQTDLIQAVKCLDDELRKRLEIHFFGDGPELAILQQKAKQLENDQAVFHGMELDRDKVFGEIDILVVCSEQEGLSLVIMEAMARGIPVIATRVGDSPKLVIDDQTGYVYDYSNIAQLSVRLVDLCENSGLREKLGQQAKQHMIACFSLEYANEQYQRCYH